MAEENQKVEIYSTPTCTYCELAKDFFKTNGIEYSEYDVAADLDKRTEMIEMTGQMGVPVIVINDKSVVGFDEPKIREMLEI